MTFKMKTLTTLAASLLLSTSAYASPIAFGDGGASLQSVLDDITISGPSSVDVTTDNLADDGDSYWSVGGSGGSISTMIIELAGFAADTSFGVYDKYDSTNKVVLFSGAATTGDQVLLSILLDGSVKVNFADTGIDFASLNNFGFFLDSSVNAASGGGLFFSDTSLNADGIDHLAAYQGVGDDIQIAPFAPGVWAANEYILAWEDATGGGDGDFTDMVLIVESVNPIPEPASTGLLGLGLVAMAVAMRRRRAVR